MDLSSVADSLTSTPYSLDLSETTRATLEALVSKSDELQQRYEEVHRKLGPMIRTDPEFRAYQTFHSNKLELQGPDLSTTQELIERFVEQGEPDDLRVFAAIQTVKGDSHLVEVLGQHQANLLVERIALDFSDDRPFTEADLRAINAFCIQGKSFAGEYRHTDRLNLGQFFDDDDPLWFAREMDHAVEVTWHEVPDNMRAICAFISEAHSCPPLAAAVSHAWFTRVHPFHDGNGRTARLLANLVLIRNGWPPITITKGKRDEYLDALAESDIAGDIRLLFELFTDSLDLNLSELEDERFWRKRYRLELQQNNQQRVDDWILLAREFVQTIRGYLRQDGWVLERVSMPDSPTYLLLEEGERRAATLFGKFRHPDRREIRVGIGFMSPRLRQVTDFDPTIDGQHYPPTLYMTERNFLPDSDFPYVHRSESALKIREFTFIPGGASKAIFLWGGVAPTPQRSTIDDLCAALARDIASLKFPGYAQRFGSPDREEGEVEPVSATPPGGGQLSPPGPNPLSLEMSQALNALTIAVERESPGNWEAVVGLLLKLIAEGNCLARSFELDGVLLSTIGSVVKPLALHHPEIGPWPERMIDVTLRAVASVGIEALEVVASRHSTPHPTLVHRDRRYGRQTWGQNRPA